MTIIEARPNRVRTVRHICRLREHSRDAVVLAVRLDYDVLGDELTGMTETTRATDRDDPLDVRITEKKAVIARACQPSDAVFGEPPRAAPLTRTRPQRSLRASLSRVSS